MRFDFLIRFGVHKDREVLRTLRSSISGLVIPAHILCYSTDATIAAISYIKKDYYIDPMTFLYSKNIKEYLGEDRKRFKPSIDKMTASYGLIDLFVKKGYTALEVKDFSEQMISDFSQKSLNLQLKKVDERKEGAYKKYTELLSKVGKAHILSELNEPHMPKAIVPPYFFFGNLTDGWADLNIKFANKTQGMTESPIVPIICTNIDCLNDRLLDKYSNFKEVFIWIEGLDERDAEITDLTKYASFVKEASEKGFIIRNLYGTYFSIMLGKYGLAGMTNGIFYGEYKSIKAKVGGVPPVRYYLRKVHQFFILPEAIALITKFSGLLDVANDKVMRLIGRDPQNILLFEKNHSAAQTHFIYSREKEIEEVDSQTPIKLVEELEDVFVEYQPKVGMITNKSLNCLNTWASAFRRAGELGEKVG